MTAAVLAGVDLLHTDERHADAALTRLRALLPPDADADCLLATHWAQADDRPHVALSVEVTGLEPEQLWDLLLGLEPGGGHGVCLGDRTAGPPSLVDAARSAREAAAARRSGRVVHFPGAGALRGSLPVAEVLERSAVDAVRVLAAGPADPAAVLTTREHVRPTWSDGALVLLVQPAVGGTLVPFEPPDPTPCCADHG